MTKDEVLKYMSKVLNLHPDDEIQSFSELSILMKKYKGKFNELHIFGMVALRMLVEEEANHEKN